MLAGPAEEGRAYDGAESEEGGNELAVDGRIVGCAQGECEGAEEERWNAG